MKMTKLTCVAKLLAIPMLLAGAISGFSQTTVSVDSSKPWIGYMNVFDLPANGGAYMFGSAWATADLSAVFTGTNFLTLTPNSINDTNSYWYLPSGGPGATGNKIMDASMYVQDDTLAGQTITFTGTCLTNTLVNGYASVAFIKDFAPDYSANTPVTATLVAGQDFSITMQTTAGHHIQYGFETTGPDVWATDVASMGKVVVAVSNVDPTLSSLAGQALVEGQTAHFNVTAKGTAPFTYQWTLANADGTTVLSDGGRISGTTTGSLTISNIVASDAGTYTVSVQNSKGSALSIGSLVVIPLEQAKTNMLINPGFEINSFATTPDAGWVNFNGANLQSTNDFYYFSATPVVVLGGSNCFETYSTGSGSYNGCYQERPVTPGQIYTANAWFLTPAEDLVSGTGQCYLEVQFRDAGGAVLRQYRSGFIDANATPGTWINLQPTNIFAGDFVTSLGTSAYMVAPPGSAIARFQITYHADSGGSVYVDNTTLQLKAPVMTVTPTGSNLGISFPTLYGPVYQVLYKTNLTDAAWQVLTTVNGNGDTITVADPHTGSQRFYIVNTQ